MRNKIPNFLWVYMVLVVGVLHAQEVDDVLRFENPITAAYLKKHLSRKTPRLILTPQIEKDLRRKLKVDVQMQKYARYLHTEAARILEEPLLERELEGFRLLFVARNLLERMTILSMIYRIDGDTKILDRIDAELKTVCAFTDWNPQHYLDVAEMSLGVAITIDWVGRDLPEKTVDLAKRSLIEKGIKPSFQEGGQRMGWINGSNNWNSVCHGGMIAAALAIAEIDYDLAAKTISRALEKLPNSLKEYAPDGAYPEGPSYWGYGTSYAVIASNVLMTTLGTDFGIAQSPGFMESANFRLLATGPSGDFFNFADSGDRNNGDGSLLMSWFAAMTGDGLYLDKTFFDKPQDAGRFAGLGLVWLSQFKENKVSQLPLEWCGQGSNPIAIFRSESNDPTQFYLGMKGGKARLSHGNMDAGTFVFDLHGVRWVVDPGNQRYYLLNKIGFQLSNHSQDSERWSLLTKGNHGHSTITVNDARFDVDGSARITDFKPGENAEVTIDMTDVFAGNVHFLQRKFSKESKQSILIEDEFEINDATQQITWALMTTAEVQPTKNGAVLKQDGKTLTLSILSPHGLNVSVISLDPPPLEIDKSMEGLKRIEIRVPAYMAADRKGVIKVRLWGS